MSTEPLPVGDLTATVKSREVQRALLAEMAGDRLTARQHFLAAAHLELGLAADYVAGGSADLAFRSRLSAASCFWRAGEKEQAQALFDDLGRQHPDQASALQEALTELQRDYAA